MCEKCVKIDRRITDLRLLSTRVTDKQILDGISIVIEQHEATKAELHREEEGQREQG